MSGQPIMIGGLPLPSDAPLFLALVGVHILFAVTAVIAGVVAMRSVKAPGWHPRAGAIYIGSLAGVFVTATLLAALRWAEDYHLFALGALSFASAMLARTAQRSRWPSWLPIHIMGMGVSYVLLLTAFYVDNGPNLPLWNQLPPAAFWILPGLFGAPIVLRQLWRHPLMLVHTGTPNP